MNIIKFVMHQVSGTEMSKWLNELCPIILDMLQDASLIAKREVSERLLGMEGDALRSHECAVLGSIPKTLHKCKSKLF